MKWPFDFLDWEAHGPFWSIYSGYIVAMESFLEDEIKRHWEEAKSSKTNLEQHTSESAAQMTEMYVPVLRESFFISIYSLLDTNLNDVCYLIRESRNEDCDDKNRKLPPPSNSKDKGIDRSKTYWKKVLRLGFPGNRHWSEIKNLQRIRNCIVHNEGIVDIKLGEKNKKLVEDYVNRNGNLSLQNDRISLKKGFCTEVLATFDDFWTELGHCLLAE